MLDLAKCIKSSTKGRFIARSSFFEDLFAEKAVLLHRHSEMSGGVSLVRTTPYLKLNTRKVLVELVNIEWPFADQSFSTKHFSQ
jgi:hypothetical protein